MADIVKHLPPDVLHAVRVTKPVDYVEGYNDFVSRTDEKAVIAGELGKLLRSGSVIDIGAGTGDIPDNLRIDPSNYTAVEQRPEFVRTLRAKGYRVIEKLFPFESPVQYTNVLMSHVLYSPEQCEQMIEPAWKLVNPGGQLVAVTYRDNEDDYTRLLARAGHSWRGTDDARFNYLRQKFSSLGRPALSSVRSHVYGVDIDELASAVSFMATNNAFGTPESRARLQAAIVAEQSYIDERYVRPDGGYAFPIDHYIFCVNKEDSE